MSLSTAALESVLYAGVGGTEGLTGFPNIGTYLIFGVILVPVYTMIVAWFVGEPRDIKTAVMGVVYLVGITLGMWVPMFFLTVIIGAVFFGGVPEPISSPGP